MDFGEMTSTLEPSSGQSDYHISAVPLIGSEWTYIQVRPIGTTDTKLRHQEATLFPMDLNLRGCGEQIQNSEETRIKQKENPKHDFMM